MQCGKKKLCACVLCSTQGSHWFRKWSRIKLLITFQALKWNGIICNGWAKHLLVGENQRNVARLHLAELSLSGE